MDNKEPQSIVNSYFGKQGVKLFNMLLGQKPEKADAIIFLQGDKLNRVKKVQSLYENGFANKIVVTGNNERVEELNDSYLSEIKECFLSKGIFEKNIIMDDKALNTLRQAVNVIKMAKEKKWKKLIIVTSPCHLLRAYLTFVKQLMEQDWQGDIIMQAADSDWQMEILSIEMEKLKKYQKDTASIKEGIKYIINSGLIEGYFDRFNFEIDKFLALPENIDGMKKTLSLLKNSKNIGSTIFLIGNGGSSAVAEHMAFDFTKNAGLRAVAISGSPMLTALSNDYGYEKVFQEALNSYAKKNDILIAISSGGKSPNILNACAAVKKKELKIITLSGFEPDNPLRRMGDINFWVDSKAYGFLEIFHNLILHYINDSIIGSEIYRIC